MRRFLASFIGLLMLAGTTAVFAQAGYVHELSGPATVQVGGAGIPRALAVGDLINSGDTIATGANGSLIVKFEDGQVMTLNQNSAFAVRNYNYNKQNISASTAAFELLRGGLRFVSGIIGATNRNSFSLRAGTATIGIRGSDILTQLDPAGLVAVAVFAGAAAMITAQGQVAIPAGLVTTAPANAPPSAPTAIANALPAIAAVIQTLAARTLPNSTPVVVQASANAAVAQARAAVAAAQLPPNPTAEQLAAVQQLRQQAQQLTALAVTAAQTALTQAQANGGAVPTPPATPQQIQQQIQQGIQQSTENTPAPVQLQQQLQQFLNPASSN